MASKELTIERLYASPSLSGPAPTGVKYSPDGSRVTFLKAREDDSSRYDLWQFDVETGAQSMLVDSTLLEPEEVELSEEEKALRERRRIAGRKGIVDYDWGTADTILVPLGGDLHLVTLGADGAQTRQLTETEAFEYDARVSPRGNYVSFVRDGAVFVIELASGEERQITPDAEPDNAISYGVSEFVAQEEMSRYTGYWWSPDERLRELGVVEGIEHLRDVQAKGQGALLLTGHFTTLELGARFLCLAGVDFHAMYRPYENGLMDYFMHRWRERRSRLPALPRDELRTLIKALRQGAAVWYAPDQTLDPRISVFVPFFGKPVATIGWSDS